jgi:hypothetical protein
MSQPGSTPEDRYAALVQTFVSQGEATQAGKGFGANGLKVHGKNFTLFVRGKLVLKLPKARVDAIVAAGEGERFDPRKNGQQMKEWVVLGPMLDDDWLALAREAHAFVAAHG